MEIMLKHIPYFVTLSTTYWTRTTDKCTHWVSGKRNVSCTYDVMLVRWKSNRDGILDRTIIKRWTILPIAHT